MFTVHHTPRPARAAAVVVAGLIVLAGCTTAAPGSGSASGAGAGGAAGPASSAAEWQSASAESGQTIAPGSAPVSPDPAGAPASPASVAISSPSVDASPSATTTAAGKPPVTARPTRSSTAGPATAGAAGPTSRTASAPSTPAASRSSTPSVSAASGAATAPNPPASSASSESAAPSASSALSSAGSSSVSSARTASGVLATMTLAQQVGELLMVGNPAGTPSPLLESEIADYHVGSVILTGRSSAGVTHTRSVVTALQVRATSRATAGARLIVATDQEGGAVQVLQGPGFSRIPSAIDQGTDDSLATIRANAAIWGAQLARAGVTLDLAPVMDTVTQAFAPYNAPIGYYGREFGYTPYEVLMRGNAFANGLRDAHMGVTVKHFPGLGRVTGNTDTSAGVTDDVTTRTSTSLQPFAEGVRSGADAVMVSTAIYAKIAPGVPAAFSPTILQTMLRGDLGFTGVIVSDDLGQAAQVQAWSPGTRAVRFIQAGGDLVLTVNPSTVPAMYQALMERATTNASFRATVRVAALHVLRLKQRLGLLG